MNVPNRARLDRTVSLWAFAGFVAFVLALYAVVAVRRGPWSDELWSMWMNQPGLGLAAAMRERWVHDVHPPLFYLLNWLSTPLLGAGFVAHRLSNLFAVVYLALVSVYLARAAPEMRRVIVVSLVLILSNRDFAYFFEYRSYLLTLGASSALTLLLYRITMLPADFDRARDGGLAAIVVAAILLALNIHYIGAMICGVAIGIVALDQLRLRRWRWAALLVGVAAVAVVPLAAALLAERPYMQGALPGFWVQTNMREGLHFLRQHILYAAGGNIVAIVLLALALATLVPRLRTLTGGVPVRWRFAILMGLAAAIACIVLVLVNMARPAIVGRYLIPLTPICAVALASVIADRLLARAWLFVLFVGNAAAVTIAPALAEMRSPYWNEGAALIGGQVRACPGTIVYAVARRDLPPPLAGAPLPNLFEFQPWALRQVGEAHGFEPRFVRATGERRPRSPAPCPTLVWVEHVFDSPNGADVLRAAGLAVPSGGAGGVVTQRTGSGLVVTLLADAGHR